MTHYGLLVDQQWKSLCGKSGEQVRGTLVREADISCKECRKKWRAGMTRVRRLFRGYRGEE